MNMTKHFLLILFTAAVLAGCSKNEPTYPYRPDYFGEQFPGALVVNGNLDTITPPANPLHPLSQEASELPAYRGYLDCARFMDDKRYCALIGLEKARNIYFLTDSTLMPIRYDSPIVAGLTVCQVMYVRGYLSVASSGKNEYYLLRVVDIEPVDTIANASYYWHP